MRDRLARELDDPQLNPRDVAAVTRELRTTIAEIDSLPPKEESKVDELAAKRAARRRANTTAAARP